MSDIELTKFGELKTPAVRILDAHRQARSSEAPTVAGGVSADRKARYRPIPIRPAKAGLPCPASWEGAHAPTHERARTSGRAVMLKGGNFPPLTLACRGAAVPAPRNWGPGICNEIRPHCRDDAGRYRNYRHLAVPLPLSAQYAPKAYWAERRGFSRNWEKPPLAFEPASVGPFAEIGETACRH